MTYFLFVHRPNAGAVKRRLGLSADGSSLTIESLAKRIDGFEIQLKQSADENNVLLEALRQAVKESRENKKRKIANDNSNNDKGQQAKSREIAVKEIKSDVHKEVVDHDSNSASSNVVIAVLMFACNRVTVRKALDSLLAYRKDKIKFPIVVSQDCGHAETEQVIRSYGDEITYIQQPDQSSITDVPKKERKFQGYFKIARHYGWALNHVFREMKYDQVIIVEDDLEVAPDFYQFFESTLPILKADPTLWCVSAWNDNGKKDLVDSKTPELLYRTDFFGGLGWMMTKELWINEIGPKWPKSYWDDWMRQPVQRRGRACIRPEISRTKTFGKIGVSNGLFFDKHLKFIELNEDPVDFLHKNLTYLLKPNYDIMQDQILNHSPVVSLVDLKNGLVKNHESVKVIYHTKEIFKKTARALGIMDDFKSGVPRMAYKGVVSTMYKGQRVYVAPNVNWKGYDPSW